MSKITSYLPLAAAIAVLPAFAIDLPQVEDPQIAEWVRRGGEEIDRYLADPTGSFALPAQRQPWPCELSPEALGKVLGIRMPGVSPSEEERRAMAVASRNMGMKEGAVKPVDYQDVQVWPVKAACVKGKLDGDVQAWVEYTMVNDSVAAVMRNRHRKFVQAQVVQGEPKVLLQKFVQLSQETRYADPAVDEMMRKRPTRVETMSFIASTPGDANPRSLQMTRTQVFGAAPITSLTTFVTRPLGGNRSEMVHYYNTIKAGVTPMKNGKPHGLAVRYPYSTGLWNVPGGQTCWDEGEEIKTTQCRVD